MAGLFTTVPSAAASPTATILPSRVEVARASDAPTSTLVIDGTHLGIDVARPGALDLLAQFRPDAMASGRTNGAKNVVICGQVGDQLRVQFFQGLSDGSIDPTVEVCINSAAAAVVVARYRWGWCLQPQIQVLFGTRDQFRFTLPKSS